MAGRPLGARYVKQITIARSRDRERRTCIVALVWNRTVEWDDGDWRHLASCRSTEPDLFFPIGTTGPAVDQIEAAKRVCRSCEAQEPCLDFALATNQESGRLGRHFRGGAPQAPRGLAGGAPPGLLTPLRRPADPGPDRNSAPVLVATSQC